jgi:hypothetical protein
MENSEGAISLADTPISQQSCQKLALDPSPMEISVAAANNYLSNSSLEPTHGLSGDFQANQSHRSLRWKILALTEQNHAIFQAFFLPKFILGCSKNDVENYSIPT